MNVVTAVNVSLSVYSLSDHTETPPPPGKVAPPPKLLIQEDICSEICQSKEQFTQSLGGLSEVPPPSPFYTNSCCQASPEHTGELHLYRGASSDDVSVIAGSV